MPRAREVVARGRLDDAEVLPDDHRTGALTASRASTPIIASWS